MSRPCDDLAAFVDGQLDEERAESFRAHLAECDECFEALEDTLQLAALAEPMPARMVAAAPALSTGAEVVPIHRGAGASSSGARPAARRPRRIAWLLVGTGLAAAAALVVMVRPPRPAPESPLGQLAVGPSRPLEVRLARAEVDRYRPRDAHLGAASASHAEEPLAVLGQLRERSDLEGLGIAYLLTGNLGQAAAWLTRAGDTPEVILDRAALELVRGNAGEAIALLSRLADQALGSSPAATWNRALALRDLGLLALSAQAFESVAAKREPGWADEAGARAAELRRDLDGRRAAWKALSQRGTAMVQGGAPIDPAEARARPGLSRHYFYHALRAAPSRERVLALRPLAQALDGAASGRALEALLDRVAAADFRTRAPLARAYLDLYLADPLPTGTARAELLGRLRRGGQPDLLAGALQIVGISSASDAPGAADAAAETAELVALARESGDPWQVALAEYEAARRAIAGGELLRAEQRLLEAIPACHRGGVEYRCAYLERALSGLYITLNRPVEARRVAMDGWQHVRAAGEWMSEALFLQDLAIASHAQRDDALARAYLDEVLGRHVDVCSIERFVRLQRAQMSLHQLRPEAARAELAEVPLCGEAPSLGWADVWSELARFGLPAPEAERVRAELSRMRAAGRLSPGEHAIAFELEGRLRIFAEPAAARPLLETAIAEADRLPTHDVDARRARAFAYSALVLESGRRGAWDQALSLLAREIGTPAAPRCAVGVALDYDELVVAARGPAGAPVGVHRAHGGDAVPSAQVVDPAIRAALAGCEVVDVFARPPFHGRSDLLPRELAWRFRVGRPASATAAPGAVAAAAARSPAAAPPRHLLVSVTRPPATLDLEALAPYVPPAREAGVEQVLLEGAEATPSRVLAELPRATEIDVHAHGLVDATVSDVSLLVLSPGADGQYALTAGQVRRSRLDGAPLVVLGACRSARTAPYLIAPWSLPVAFIEAGARSVLASTADVRDQEAEPFFRAVRARIRAGAPAAVALRDERARFLLARPDSSVGEVLLFE